MYQRPYRGAYRCSDSVVAALLLQLVDTLPDEAAGPGEFSEGLGAGPSPPQDAGSDDGDENQGKGNATSSEVPEVIMAGVGSQGF